MVPPAYSVSPPTCMFPPMPLPLPHPFLYRNARGWPPVPRIIRSQNPPIRSKKIICIRDPLTLQDVTEEILSSATSNLASKRSQSSPQISPPVKSNIRRSSPMATSMPIPMGFVHKPPTTPQVILKCFHEEDYYMPDEDQSAMAWQRRDIFTNGLGGCSWPPMNNPFMKHGSFPPPWDKREMNNCVPKSRIRVYNRAQLMMLRFQPFTMIAPVGIKHWDIIRAKDIKESSPTQNSPTEINQVAPKPASKLHSICPKCGKAKLNGDATPKSSVSKNGNLKLDAVPKSGAGCKTKTVKKTSGSKKEIKNKGFKNDDKLARGDFSFEEPQLKD